MSVVLCQSPYSTCSPKGRPLLAKKPIDYTSRESDFATQEPLSRRAVAPW